MATHHPHRGGDATRRSWWDRNGLAWLTLFRPRVVSNRNHLRTVTRRRHWRAHGGAGTLLDLLAGFALWAVLLSGLVSLVQVGRVWEAAQHAAYDAAEGVSTYGCWTSSVTQVVQSDMQTVHLSGTPTASLHSSTGSTGRAIYVGTGADPVLSVQIGLPMTVSWVGIGIAKATMTGSAHVTAADFRDESAIGGTTCVTPQA